MTIISSKINLSFTHPNKHVVDWIDDVANRLGIEFDEFETKDQVKSEPDKNHLFKWDLMVSEYF